MTSQEPFDASIVAAQGSLRAKKDFTNLWAGQAISTLGTSVTNFALPLVGVLTLRLNALQVGILAAASYLPTVLIGPFVGPIVDRLNKKRLLVATDVGRAALVGLIPFTYLVGLLSYPVLLAVGMAMGVLTLLFNVGHQAILPLVVPSRELPAANGKLEAAKSLSDIGGPGIGGWLTGAGGPAVALVADSASYAASAFFLLRVSGAATDSKPDHPLNLHSLRQGIWSDTKRGFSLLWSDDILRTVAVSYSTLAFFAQMQMSVYLLFLVRGEQVTARSLGLIFTVSGLFGFFAALASGKISERLGIGKLVVGGQIIMVIGGVLLAAIGGSTLQIGATILAAEICWDVGLSFYGVGSRTVFQWRTDETDRGKVLGSAASLRGVLVCGAYVVGGAMAELLGLRSTLVFAAAGMVAALSLIIRPSVWKLEEQLDAHAQP
jgi:MFS family permease